MNIMSMGLLSTLCCKVSNSNNLVFFIPELRMTMKYHLDITTYLSKAHMYMELMHFILA